MLNWDVIVYFDTKNKPFPSIGIILGPFLLELYLINYYKLCNIKINKTSYRDAVVIFWTITTTTIVNIKFLYKLVKVYWKNKHIMRNTNV